MPNLQTSVADPFHFDTALDPNPRIRFVKTRVRIRIQPKIKIPISFTIYTLKLSKQQGPAETPAANRGEIGPAQPSNTHYLTLKCHKNVTNYGLNVILSTLPNILNLEII